MPPVPAGLALVPLKYPGEFYNFLMVIRVPFKVKMPWRPRLFKNEAYSLQACIIPPLLSFYFVLTAINGTDDISSQHILIEQWHENFMI